MILVNQEIVRAYELGCFGHVPNPASTLKSGVKCFILLSKTENKIYRSGMKNKYANPDRSVRIGES